MILARLLSASPSIDGETWDLKFRWHTDAWHTDAYAQNPAPFQRNPQLGPPNRPPYPWQPGLGLWGLRDALFPQKLGFQLDINTSNSPQTLDIFGDTPINAPAASGINAPQCPISASVSSTGGSIPSGSYLIAIAADDTGPVSPYFISAIIPPGTTTGSITVSGVIWTAAAPNVGVYLGTNSLNMVNLGLSGSLRAWSGSATDTYGNPTTFLIRSLVLSGGAGGNGLPDPKFNSFLFQAKDIIHGGVWGAAVNVVGLSGGSITLRFIGAAWTTNQWMGYVVSSYGPVPDSAGVFNYKVISNTADTLTLDPSYVGLGPSVGTVFVMRAAATSITSNTIGDANFVNSYAPSGLAVNAEAGNLIRIIAGTGANQPPATILSNTATVLTIAGSWAITPDATSQYIIEAPGWRYSLQTGTIQNNSFNSNLLVGSLPLLNFLGKALLIEVLTVDQNDNWSVERYAPIREVYVPATIPPAATAAPSYAVPVVSSIATPDASQLSNLLVLTENTVLAAPINVPLGGINAPWSLVTQQGTGAAGFNGSGLNDATSGGTYGSYAPGDTPHTYVVTISSTGSPDHFTWTKDGGAASSPIAITGAAQALADDITITFAATTGHNAGDSWTIQVGGFMLDTTAYPTLLNSLANLQSPPGTETIQGFSSSASGTRCPTFSGPVPIPV